MKYHTASTARRQTQVNDDTRELLVKDGRTGPVTAIAIPEAMVTSVRGVLFDIDPKLFAPSAISRAARKKPKVLFQEKISPMLARHPLLAKAQVRSSGTGIHVLLMFGQPIPLSTPAGRVPCLHVGRRLLVNLEALERTQKAIGDGVDNRGATSRAANTPAAETKQITPTKERP